MEERLAAALARIPGCAAASVARIPGGITNQSYRVDVDGRPCVLRLDGRSAHALGIDREHELVALRSMASLGIGAEVVFSDPAAGVLVTRVVPGKPLELDDLHQGSVMERVARLVRRVHDGPAFPGVFSPFAVVHDYLEKASALGRTIGGSEPARRLMASLEQCLADDGSVRPCHNDLLAGNILIGQGALHIIDWEYAAMGNPLFDVANFITNLQLAQMDADRFFDAYLGRPSSERERAQLSLFAFVSDLREAAWGMLQSAEAELDFDFQAYGAQHMSRALAYAETKRFADALSFMKGRTRP